MTRRRRNLYSTDRSLSGFTVVELMMATMVFSVVLLMIVMGILQFTRVYYKGLTERNVQSAARNVADAIGQSVQFGSANVTVANGATPGTLYAFCANDKRYSYVLGNQVSDSPNTSLHQIYHAMVVDDASGCTDSVQPQNLRQANVSGRDLLAAKMRLSRLEVSQAGSGLYKIRVKVVYGEDDLLTSPPDSLDATCIVGQSGSQFCAMADITTVVSRRVGL